MGRSELLASAANDFRSQGLELRRFLRQEQACGHASPTDTVFLGRMIDFLENRVPSEIERGGSLEEVDEDAKLKALDLRRFLRQEQQSNQISPTDASFLTRLITFLEKRIELIDK